MTHRYVTRAEKRTFLSLITRWLASRVPKALEEQSRGVNQLALIFPNPSGGLFGEQNLRNRVWAPAAEELGWAMDEYVTALGKKRRLFRFTLHALRDRFANTAIHEWRSPEYVLLQQGSWEDSETVRRLYAGVTDESQSIAMRIHGWSALGPVGGSPSKWSHLAMTPRPEFGH